MLPSLKQKTRLSIEKRGPSFFHRHSLFKGCQQENFINFTIEFLPFYCQKVNEISNPFYWLSEILEEKLDTKLRWEIANLDDSLRWGTFASNTRRVLNHFMVYNRELLRREGAETICFRMPEMAACHATTEWLTLVWPLLEQPVYRVVSEPACRHAWLLDLFERQSH